MSLSDPSAVDHHQVGMAGLDVGLVIIGDVLALQRAYLHVVERDVVGEVLVLRQTIIRDDRHIVSLRGVDDLRGLLGILGRENQNAVTLGEVSLSLGLLCVRVAIGVRVVNVDPR